MAHFSLNFKQYPSIQIDTRKEEKCWKRIKIGSIGLSCQQERKYQRIRGGDGLHTGGRSGAEVNSALGYLSL